MKVYLDAEYRCHLMNDGTMKEVETDFFDGKCAAYIEGYRLIPTGESWTRADGVVFHGKMIAAAEDYSALEKAQVQYELDEARRIADLGILNEISFTATRNYSVGDFISIYGVLYEVISSIPDGCTIIIGQDVIEVSIEYYLEKLKEDNNEETDF